MNPEPEQREKPRTALVAQLGEIWCRTLRVPEIAPDSNFFDLGGDSLLAVGLFLAIEKETGVNLPITTIYDAPTIAELAELIAGGTAAQDFSPLVMLNEGGDGVPLFIVHGIGGTVMELAVLGRAVRISAPVYALQAQGLDGNRPPLESVHEMAQLYLDHVRRLQPIGPYWLSGYSFGGLVALEMARQLRRENREAAAPILMDAYAHPSTWPRISRLKMTARRTFHLAGQYGRAPLRRALPALLARLQSAALHKDSRARLHDWLLDQNPDLPAPLLRVREAGSVALARYVPSYYPGRIVFLKASHSDPEFPNDPERIWRPLTKGMELYIVPGRHRTMVSDHATALAGRLTACVLAARRKHESRLVSGTALRAAAKAKGHLEPQAV